MFVIAMVAPKDLLHPLMLKNSRDSRMMKRSVPLQCRLPNQRVEEAVLGCRDSPTKAGLVGR